MSNAMLDTLKYCKALIAGGIPQKQAEAQAEALASVIDNQLATKQDLLATKKELNDNIKELKQEFKSDIKELHQEVKTDILELKNDLLIKLAGLMGLTVTIIGILIAFFHS